MENAKYNNEANRKSMIYEIRYEDCNYQYVDQMKQSLYSINRHILQTYHNITLNYLSLVKGVHGPRELDTYLF